MEALKVTIKAMLINVKEEDRRTINIIMSIFCSAVRFSYKRILENMKIGDLEKLVACKYGLNIRQSKDAVENARQTIASQKELVKMNYGNCSKKITAIENILRDEKKKLTPKK